ncbi:MAG TPA: GNAT family N-acetyltransferase [candidate division Zixibacteria bacterium]|nr:GNAT family N-acetyltransferase [candidate division Zixibacteria bacterium]
MATITKQIDVRDSENKDQGFDEMEMNEMVSLTMNTTDIAAEEYRLRGATMDDVVPAFELFDTCSKHMIGKSETTLSHVQTEWTSPGFDLANSVRVVETLDGKIVGYVEVWDIEEPPVNLWIWGRVHPDHEGRGIGTKLMSWAEKRARQAIKRAPNGAKVVMRSGTFSHYDPAHDLLSGVGMNFIRHFLTMAIEFDEEPETPTWPTGILVRSMEGEEELEAVVRAVREAFRDHWGYLETSFEQEFDQWLHFNRNDAEYDPTLWFLAMDGEEIAGISLCRLKSDEDPDMGWVNVLGVIRPWRRKGLGLALLHHSFGELKRRGQSSAGLGVDASSLTGATGLYEKAGMHSIRQFDLYEKELRPGRDLTKRSI